MKRFENKANFNIASTVINENIRISTAAIFYDEWFGERFQLETWVFSKEKGKSQMKIHKVYENQNGIDYCKRFHEKTVAMVRSKLKKPLDN